MSPTEDDRRVDAADGPARVSEPTRTWTATPTARPERPELSDRTPAPVVGRDAIPRPILRAQSLWFVSMSMLFFAVVTLFLTRAGLVANLVDLLRQQDPDVSDVRLAEVSPFIIYGVLAVLLVVGLVEWGFATILLRRRRWPRMVMVPLAVVHVVIAAGCSLVIPLSAWQGWLVVAVLGISALVALTAGVRAFAPSVTRWIRTRRADEAEETDGGEGVDSVVGADGADSVVGVVGVVGIVGADGVDSVAPDPRTR